MSPQLRVRFATSHPKDMSDRLLETMASMPNICRAIHLPAQSGASTMLRRMNRKYDREWYRQTTFLFLVPANIENGAPRFGK